MKKRLAVIVCSLLFVAGSSGLLVRESAQLYLQSGMDVYETNPQASIELFREGVRRDPDDYLLRNYLAKALQKRAFELGLKNLESAILLKEARMHLNRAINARLDSFDYLAIASVHETEGALERALANYNISFFFSQNVSELPRWISYRRMQAEVSEKNFKAGEVCISLIMAYNEMAKFKPFEKPLPGARLIEEFLLSFPPPLWLAEGAAYGESGKEVFKKVFMEKTDEEKKLILDSFSSGRYLFVSEFLKG